MGSGVPSVSTEREWVKKWVSPFSRCEMGEKGCHIRVLNKTTFLFGIFFHIEEVWRTRGVKFFNIPKSSYFPQDIPYNIVIYGKEPKTIRIRECMSSALALVRPSRHFILVNVKLISYILWSVNGTWLKLTELFNGCLVND